MSPFVLVLLALLLLLVAAVYTVVIYNGLVALKHAVGKHFANIDVLLKQRYDELPKLIEACRQYMSFERDTLEQVIRARGAVADAAQSQDIRALGQAEGVLRSGLGRLFALAENYPELKASETFRHLQQRISSIENAIADRREVYNEAVNNNNVRIEQFPDVLVSRAFGFRTFELLEFRAEELADVDLRALFNS